MPGHLGQQPHTGVATTSGCYHVVGMIVQQWQQSFPSPRPPGCPSQHTGHHTLVTLLGGGWFCIPLWEQAEGDARICGCIEIPPWQMNRTGKFS